MSDPSNILVLLTGGFPALNAEPFIENEMKFLQESFKEIIIIPTVQEKNQEFSPLPKNTSVIHTNLKLTTTEKIYALQGVFDFDFWRELKHLFFSYKQVLTKSRLNTILVSLYRAKKIKKLLLKQNLPIESTIFYSYWCDDAAIALAMLKRDNSSYKTTARVHGWDLYHEVSTIKFLPFRSFLRQYLNKIFPISEMGIKYIQANWAGKSLNLQVSKLGIENQYKFNLSSIDGKFRIVSCSRMIELKRIHLIIEALAYFSLTDDVEWIHFGSGPLHGKLEAIATQVLNNKVKWQFKGAVSNDTIMEWYSQNPVDLFINVSTTEGIPVSIMEAMSFGIPVLATNVGGTSEIVNESNGKLLPAQIDGHTLFQYINNFKNLSPEMITTLRSNAHKTWMKSYDAKKNYLNFINQLKAL